MISCKKFYDYLKSKEINFFTGVPDSLLKDFCAYVTDNAKIKDNVITANEGNAIGLATGHYLATGKFGLVYMQNSGLGNAINPLTSLSDKDVYSIPMLLVIGWRGEPGKRDEPQHVKMGKVTDKLLDAAGIPYKILEDDFENTIEQVISYMNKEKSPFAIIVKKGTFEEYKLQKDNSQNDSALKREESIKRIISLLDDEDIIVSTTGKTSRELFEIRKQNNQGNQTDFLTVGSMGHSSSIALGIALEKPERNVYCFDGDGALIMHMGALSVISQLKPKNFKHVVFNNYAHDSVGGQPTAADSINIPAIAKANGYKHVFCADNMEELSIAFEKLKSVEGPALLEINVKKGSRKDLGRPTITPIENKEAFMDFLRG